VLGPLLNRSGLYMKNRVLLRWTTHARSVGPPLAPISENYPSVFALLPVHLGTLVTQIPDDLGFPFSTEHIRSLRDLTES